MNLTAGKRKLAWLNRRIIIVFKYVKMIYTRGDAKVKSFHAIHPTAASLSEAGGSEFKVVSYYECQTFRWDHYDATVFYYINTGNLLFKIQGLFKDHILKFQGPYLLLFTLRFDINYQNNLIIMGLFS